MSDTTNLGMNLMPTNPSAPETIYSQAMNRLDAVIAGKLTKNCAAGGTITLTQTETQANWLYKLTGAPGAAFILQPYAKQRPVCVWNTTGKKVTVQMATATTTVVIPDGGVAWIMFDGSANVWSLDNSQTRTVALTAVAANTSFVVPNGYGIRSIFLVNTTANAVTGGVKLGTTSGATDVIVAQAVAANAKLKVADSALLLNIFSITADQTLFLQAVTAWNSASLSVWIQLERLT